MSSDKIGEESQILSSIVGTSITGYDYDGLDLVLFLSNGQELKIDHTQSGPFIFLRK
jgi:hypothetical protein